MVGGLFLPASQLALRAWWPPNLGDWAFDNATESKNKQGLSVMNTQDTQDTCYEEVAYKCSFLVVMSLISLQGFFFSLLICFTVS